MTWTEVGRLTDWAIQEPQNINVFWLSNPNSWEFVLRKLFPKKRKSCVWEDLHSSVSIKGKRWGARKSDGLQSSVWGLMAWSWDLPLSVCVVLDKWLDLPKSVSARMEGGKSGWESRVGPESRSPGSMKRARGALQVFDLSSTSGKLSWWWHIRYMQLARRWR